MSSDKVLRVPIEFPFLLEFWLITQKKPQFGRRFREDISNCEKESVRTDFKTRTRSRILMNIIEIVTLGTVLTLKKKLIIINMQISHEVFVHYNGGAIYFRQIAIR